MSESESARTSMRARARARAREATQARCTAAVARVGGAHLQCAVASGAAVHVPVPNLRSGEACVWR